jgi:hypothetical protein
LIEACHIAGNESLLSARIGHPVPRVLDWLLGTETVPVDVFLQCVDIIVASNKRHVNDAEAFLEQVRRRNGFPPRATP